MRQMYCLIYQQHQNIEVVPLSKQVIIRKYNFKNILFVYLQEKNLKYLKINTRKVFPDFHKENNKFY